MMHCCIFPTWECQLSCPYCSIRNSKIDRSVEGVPWQTWALALKKNLPHGSIIDIAGGEPLLYPGILNLLHSIGSMGFVWGLTTNAKATDVIKQLVYEKPLGCACINVSDHPGNQEAGPNIALLREAGYRVNVHRVDVADAGQHEADARLITYQDWRGGNATDGVMRYCTAGAFHWVADPRGDLWRCVVALETGQRRVGNLFTGETQPTGAVCDFGCTSCYTEDPASWCIEMREV